MKEDITDRQKVESWLDSIEENDEAIRAEVLAHCAKDKSAREYYVRRWQESEAIQRENSLRDEMGLLPAISEWQAFGSEA